MIANLLEPALIAAFGLCIGSFINVVIHRLPKGRSLIRPGSHCPRCRAPIRWRHNVPLASFLVLGGRCGHCRRPIPWRYPLVEALLGALAGALWWRWPGQGFWLFLSIWAVAILVAIAFIDLDTFLIPNELSLGLLALGLAAAPLNPLLGSGAGERLLASAAGALGGFLLCWGVAVFGEFLFKKEAMGGGDIKLLAAVGAWSGALGAFDCLVVGSLFGAFYGGSMVLRRRLARQDPIPFGPFLSLGAILNFFYILPLGFPFHLG